MNGVFGITRRASGGNVIDRSLRALRIGFESRTKSIPVLGRPLIQSFAANVGRWTHGSVVPRMQHDCNPATALWKSLTHRRTIVTVQHSDLSKGLRKVPAAGAAARGFACGVFLKPMISKAFGDAFVATSTERGKSIFRGARTLTTAFGGGVESLVPMGSSGSLLLKFALVDLALQWGVGAISCIFKSEKVYDIVGTGSFILLGGLSLVEGGRYFPRQVLVTALVALWSARLASTLFIRVMKVGKDSRFDGVRENPVKFMGYWTVQAVWVWATLLPVMLLNIKRVSVPFIWTDALGLACWVGGFAIESIADYQKEKFRENPANKGRWIDTGLWRYSQHPNYFGEMAMWWGIFALSVPALRGFELLAGLISPVLVMHLLINVSGVPLQEAGNRKKGWHNIPEYMQYKRATPLLVPWPVKARKEP